MSKYTVIFFILCAVFIGGIYLFTLRNSTQTSSIPFQTDEMSSQNNEGASVVDKNPLSIESLKNGSFLGSDIVIEETLSPGSNYNRYIASYKSEGLKIYALLTVPNGTKPESGWPVIIFNHGYIPPDQYVTTERYIAYTDAFSREGYIVFRSDYRGHGNSEGVPNSYGSNGYTIDILNAVSSIKRFEQADPNRIGMWGHSMGGHITLRSMVVTKDIRAGVIWAGVVASYPDLIARWRRGTTTPSPFPTTSARGGWRRDFIERYGTPEENPEFWDSISSTSYLNDISGPLQLHHGTQDTSVPVEFSETLAEKMRNAQKEVELYTYAGDDHNISRNFGLAMQRSVSFFNRYLKSE